LNGRSDDSNPNSLNHPSEEATELAFPVANQKVRRLSEGSRMPKVLGNPAIPRRTAHAEVDDTTGGVIDDEERKHGAEPSIVSAWRRTIDEARERLARYYTRPTLSLERLSPLPDGRVAYQVKYPRKVRNILSIMVERHAEREIVWSS
jgi:hypothetical protein